MRPRCKRCGSVPRKHDDPDPSHKARLHVKAFECSPGLLALEGELHHSNIRTARRTCHDYAGQEQLKLCPSLDPQLSSYLEDCAFHQEGSGRQKRRPLLQWKFIAGTHLSLTSAMLWHAFFRLETPSDAPPCDGHGGKAKVQMK